MKRLISTAVALSLLTSASAMAMPQDDHRDNRGGRPRGEAPRGQPHGGGQRGGPPGGAPHPQAAQPQAAQAQAVPQAAQPQAAPQRGPGWERGGQQRGGQNAQAQAVPQAAPQRGPGWEHGGQNPQVRGQAVAPAQRGPGWERGAGARPPAVRPQDRAQRDFNRPRYERRDWPFQNRSTHRYRWRGPAYVLPYGFYAHNWIYGEIMPWGWYTPNYYIDDWAYYGLEPPPIGCEWVREGGDAVLVDIYTGRVLSVEYGLFY